MALCGLIARRSRAGRPKRAGGSSLGRPLLTPLSPNYLRAGRKLSAFAAATANAQAANGGVANAAANAAATGNGEPPACGPHWLGETLQCIHAGESEQCFALGTLLTLLSPLLHLLPPAGVAVSNANAAANGRGAVANAQAQAAAIGGGVAAANANAQAATVGNGVAIATAAAQALAVGEWLGAAEPRLALEGQTTALKGCWGDCNKPCCWTLAS